MNTKRNKQNKTNINKKTKKTDINHLSKYYN